MDVLTPRWATTVPPGSAVKEAMLTTSPPIHQSTTITMNIGMEKDEECTEFNTSDHLIKVSSECGPTDVAKLLMHAMFPKI